MSTHSIGHYQIPDCYLCYLCMSQTYKIILIGVSVAIIATVAYFFFGSKNDKSTSWRTDPAKVDIVVSENKHEPAPTPAPVAADTAAASPAVVEVEETEEPIEVYLEASSVNELADKIKSETEDLLSNNPYLSPSGFTLDLSTNRFSCIFTKTNKRSNLIKLGLYFGPLRSGCESCLTVMQKNPGSVVFISAKGKGLVGQVIGLK